MSYMDDMLFEALQRGNRLDEENTALRCKITVLKRTVTELQKQLAVYTEEERKASIAARLLQHCEDCDDQRWIWSTCGEGTCELNDPCPTCNADSLLPMDWDAVE